MPSSHSSPVPDLPDNRGIKLPLNTRNISVPRGLSGQITYKNVSGNINFFFTVLRSSHHFFTGFLNTVTKRVIIGNVSYFLNTMSYIVMTEEVF